MKWLKKKAESNEKIEVRIVKPRPKWLRRSDELNRGDPYLNLTVPLHDLVDRKG